MALPSSGAISFGSIAGEMGISAANSLSYLSGYAGNSTGYVPQGLTTSPYAMGEFFNFSFQSMTFTARTFREWDPCSRDSTYYLGSDGLLYYGAYAGSGRVSGIVLFQYGYYDWFEGVYYWDNYYMSDGQFFYQGNQMSGCS